MVSVPLATARTTSDRTDDPVTYSMCVRSPAIYELFDIVQYNSHVSDISSSTYFGTVRDLPLVPGR
jgi:hypothetical protein